MLKTSRTIRFTILFAMLAVAIFGGQLTQAKNSPVEPMFEKNDSLTCTWGNLVLNSSDANVLNGAAATGTLEQVKMLVCSSNAPKVPNVPGTPAQGAEKVTLSPCPADGSSFELPVPAAIERISKGNAVLAGSSCPVVPPVVNDKTNNGNHFGTNKIKVTLCPSGETSGELTIPHANNLIASGGAVALGGSCPVVTDADSNNTSDVVADTATDAIIPAVVTDPIIPTVITLPNEQWTVEVDEVTSEITVLNPAGVAAPGQQPEADAVVVEVKVNTPTTDVPACDKAPDKNEPKKCP